MRVKLTLHAREQCHQRGFSTDEVESVVNKYASRIGESRSWEVRVVVKKLSGKVYLPDGSNGDVILACVDPVRMTVKTVMLQRYSQVVRKASCEADYIL